MIPNEELHIKKETEDLMTRIEKHWNRLKIARAAGRRDFTSYEYVLYDILTCFRDFVVEHERRLEAIEKSRQDK